MDMFVQNTSADTCTAGRVDPPVPHDRRDGLLRRQHRHRAVELRAALRDERQLVRHDLRPVHPGRAQPDLGPDPRRHAGAQDVPRSRTSPRASVINDPDPAFDDCSTTTTATTTSAMPGKNIGDLLNAKGVTWGWFQGGFRPTSQAGRQTAVCGATHTNVGGVLVPDYSPHHEPFQYYASTANPHHLPPTLGGHDRAHRPGQPPVRPDRLLGRRRRRQPARRQLPQGGRVPGRARRLLRPARRAALPGPDHQRAWRSCPVLADTAIVIAYDDSDGWYDHVMPPIVNQSNDPAEDALTGPGHCGTGAAAGAYQDRCGYGPRLPLLVISPYARSNYVDHTLTDQTSILRFIEDNWSLGRIGLERRALPAFAGPPPTAATQHPQVGPSSTTATGTAVERAAGRVADAARRALAAIGVGSGGGVAPGR